MAQKRVLLSVTVVAALVLLGTTLASSGAVQVARDWVRVKDATANRFASVDDAGAVKVSVATLPQVVSRDIVSEPIPIGPGESFRSEPIPIEAGNRYALWLKVSAPSPEGSSFAVFDVTNLGEAEACFDARNGDFTYICRSILASNAVQWEVRIPPTSPGGTVDDGILFGALAGIVGD